MKTMGFGQEWRSSCWRGKGKQKVEDRIMHNMTWVNKTEYDMTIH